MMLVVPLHDVELVAVHKVHSVHALGIHLPHELAMITVRAVTLRAPSMANYSFCLSAQKYREETADNKNLSDIIILLANYSFCLSAQK